MPNLAVQVNSTGVSTTIVIQDYTSTVGAGLGSVTYTSSGLVGYYRTPAGAASSVSFANLSATTSAWSSGGLLAVPNMQGVYRFDLPNAALTTGPKVTFMLSGASNMAPCWFDVEIDGYNNQNGVNLGLTALPTATCTAPTGSLITEGTGAGQLSTASGLVTANSVTGSVGSVSSTVSANITGWLGSAPPTPDTAGCPKLSLVDSPTIYTGTCTTAGTSTSIALNPIPSAVAGWIVGAQVDLIGGTGKGQTRNVTAYSTGGSATVDSAWSPTAGTPDNTTVWALRKAYAPALNSSLQPTISQTFPTNFSSTLISAGGLVTANSVTGSVGSISGVTFPTRFSSLAIDTNGDVTANSVTGSVGSISGVTFPTHFSSLAIDSGGDVTANSVTGSVGSIAGVTFPTNFSATLIDSGGHVTASSVTGSVGSVVGGVGSVTGSVGSIAGVTFPTNFSATLIDSGGHVTANSVTGSVGSIAGVTFPSNFSAFLITAGGLITANSVTGSVGSVVASVVASSVTGNVGGSVVGSVASVTGSVGSVVSPVVASTVTGNVGGVVSDVVIASNGLDSVMVDGLNFRQSQAQIMASCCGTTSGAGTSQLTIGVGGGATREVAQTDANGNRTSVVLTPPS